MSADARVKGFGVVVDKGCTPETGSATQPRIARTLTLHSPVSCDFHAAWQLNSK